AVKNFNKIIFKYLGSVVKPYDNFFSCLNSSIFSDGTFVYIPKNTICPIELSSYFRINDEIGQFERTLIICEENSSLSYLEGCTASIKKKNQLHTAIVEIIIKNNSVV
ncbi:MAG: Fe-S cluster assembly protein SufB, partial [Candidatus Portiera aleyrodidarum]|nr:Fe-S cluster assembly protein SufB [Candidatus Portiera aleyrodidarum]